jgi:hypothetical protein
MQSSPDEMSGYVIVPFSEWATGNSLPWWESFTHLKHDRLSNFFEANLRNALYSLAAAFIILTFRNAAEFQAGRVPPELYDLFFPKYWGWKGRVTAGTFTWR